MNQEMTNEEIARTEVALENLAQATNRFMDEIADQFGADGLNAAALHMIEAIILNSSRELVEDFVEQIPDEVQQALRDRGDQ